MPTKEVEVVDAPAPVEAQHALVQVQQDAGVDLVTIRREPAEVLIDARKAAKALMEVIAQKKHRVVFNDEQYIENEDWQFIARFYGLTAKLESDRFVQFGNAQGFEATVVILDVNGIERSRATSMCLNDEEKWSARAKYAWVYVTRDGGHSVEDPGKDQIVWEDNPNKPGSKRPKKERVQIGVEAVPLFQLRSMAQTRASSKAFANVLRFVPLLAGLKGTPAEELDVERLPRESETTKTSTFTPTHAETDASQSQQTSSAKPTSSASSSSGKKGNGKPISEAQQKRLFAKMRDRAEKVGMDGKEFRETMRQQIVALLNERGVSLDTDRSVAEQIPWTHYDDVCNLVDNYTK